MNAPLLHTLTLVQRLRMGQVERFHTRPLIRRQTTAEHSGRVALLLILQWPEVTVTALRAALFHDMAESFTGDVPAPVKWLYPGIGAALSAIEGEVEARYGLTTGMLSPEELWWLKWCDNLEGALKCLEELAMGNQLAVPPLLKWINILRDWVVRYPAQVSAGREAPASMDERLQALNTMVDDLEDLRHNLGLVAEQYQ